MIRLPCEGQCSLDIIRQVSEIHRQAVVSECEHGILRDAGPLEAHADTAGVHQPRAPEVAVYLPVDVPVHAQPQRTV